MPLTNFLRLRGRKASLFGNDVGHFFKALMTPWKMACNFLFQ